MPTGTPICQQPRSRHSYWSQIYVPTTDRYCAVSAFGTFPNGLAAPRVDCFDFTTRRWSQMKDAPNAGGLLTTTFDPSTNRVWVMGNRSSGTGYLAEWDPAADTWTKRSTSPSGVNDRSGPLLDTKRRRLVFLGGGNVRMFDLTQPGMLVSQLITLKGDAEIALRDRPGFAYDPVNDKYVAYSGVEGGGTRDIYIIDPVTWTSTRTTLGGPVVPAIPASVDTGSWFNGIYGRLAYIPTKNAFIFINNHVKDTVFFFKLSADCRRNRRGERHRVLLPRLGHVLRHGDAGRDREAGRRRFRRMDTHRLEFSRLLHRRLGTHRVAFLRHDVRSEELALLHRERRASTAICSPIPTGNSKGRCSAHRCPRRMARALPAAHRSIGSTTTAWATFPTIASPPMRTNGRG